MYHDTPLAGHKGPLKTLTDIRQTYYWPTMSADITTYIDSCHACLTAKKDSHSHHSPMTPLPPTYKPFQTVHIDLVENLRPDRKHGIVTVVDRYSKMVIAWPCKEATSEQIAKDFYANVVCPYGGFPTHIISDRGQNLVSKLFTAFFKYFGTTLKQTTAHRPRCNGLVERAQRTMIQQLRASIETQENWPELLPSILFAMNSSVHSATGFQPFELVFGTPSRLFPDLLISQKASMESVPKTQQEALQSLLTKHRISQKLMIQHFSRYEQQMKLRYDSQSRDRNFQVADIVYINNPPKLNPKSADTKKLAKVRIGPYQVTALKSKHTVKLRNIKTGKYIPYAVNTDRLKRGFLRQDMTFKPYETQELENLTEDQMKDLQLM